MSVHTQIVNDPAVNNTVIQRRIDTIQRLDLEPIKFKLIKEHGWTLESADQVEKFYKLYLELHILYPQTTHVPTIHVDEMWHAHILDTAKYMRDCNEIFGYYLHHYPYLGTRGEQDAIRLETMFGETAQRFRDRLESEDFELLMTGCGGGCGGGGGDSGGDSGGGTASCSSGKPAPSSCTTVIPTSSCTSGSSDDRKKKKDEPPATGSGWWPWRRKAPGLNLSDSSWFDTVDPEKLISDGRPDRLAVLALVENTPAAITAH